MYYSTTNKFVLSSFEKFKAFGYRQLKLHTVENFGTSIIVDGELIGYGKGIPYLLFSGNGKHYAMSSSRTNIIPAAKVRNAWEIIISNDIGFDERPAILTEKVVGLNLSSIEELINVYRQTYCGFVISYINDVLSVIIDINIANVIFPTEYLRRTSNYMIQRETEFLILTGSSKESEAKFIVGSSTGLVEAKAFSTKDIKKLIEELRTVMLS